jgi:hypothetical protein
LGKPLIHILKDIDLTLNEFEAICDKFTNKSIFKVNNEGQLSRDKNGNLVKNNYDNNEL